MYSNPKILVVGDELVVCRRCQKILSEEGYEVSTGFTGKKGLDF